MVSKIQVTNFELPVFVYRVDNHLELKPLILEAVEKQGIHSIIETEQRITNTDWLLPNNYVNGYKNIISSLLTSHLNALSIDLYSKTREWEVPAMWFQQYYKGDFHSPHVHGNCAYAHVYYVELPEGSSKTTLVIKNKEVEVNVKEGSILSFPGFIEHESKPNNSTRKTIIGYNNNFTS